MARLIQRGTDEAIALTGLGKVTCAQGDTCRAQDYLHQALHLLQKTGAIPDLLDVLVSLSQLWLQLDHSEDAARLLGFARQHPALLPLSQQSADQIQTALQARLLAERLSTIQQSVATMTVDEAIAYAFAVHNEPTL